MDSDLNFKENEKKVETSETSKCGDVFRSISGKYSLRCLQCDHMFVSLEKFSEHIDDHFLVISTATLTDRENNVTASESDNCIMEKVEEKLIVEDLKVEINEKRNQRKKQISTDVTDNENPSQVKKKHIPSKISRIFKEPTNIWICDICGKMFSTKNHIYQHMKLHRKAPKEHKCYLCGWEFYEKGNLTRHLRTHNNNPNAYKCDVCKKGFAQERYLSDHKKIHFPDTSHLCATCGKSFTSSSLLMRHTIVHTGEKKFSCELCKRAFSRSDKLKEHRNVHTGVKPFACSWDGCNKSFSAKKSLRFHEYAHSGIKKFKCGYCDMVFINPAARRAHEKTVHLLC